MTVDVILVSYNQGAYLQRAIDSVLEQTHEDLRLTIVDDGTTDAMRLVRSMVGFDPRVVAWFFAPTMAERNETVRYATNINLCAERTGGDYLTFLCGDDFYYPDRLARMVAKLQEGHDVVYGPQRMIDERGQEMGIRPAREVLDDAWHKVDLNSVMMTREAFNAVGGFDDRPATPELWRQADAVLWRKLTDAGYRFVPVDGDEPTDCKQYLSTGVDARVIRGETPWQ